VQWTCNVERGHASGPPGERCDGFDAGLGEPVHVITMLDNNRNGD
jgi:hypothetical protein